MVPGGVDVNKEAPQSSGTLMVKLSGPAGLYPRAWHKGKTWASVWQAVKKNASPRPWKQTGLIECFDYGAVAASLDAPLLKFIRLFWRGANKKFIFSTEMKIKKRIAHYWKLWVISMNDRAEKGRRKSNVLLFSKTKRTKPCHFQKTSLLQSVEWIEKARMNPICWLKTPSFTSPQRGGAEEACDVVSYYSNWNSFLVKWAALADISTSFHSLSIMFWSPLHWACALVNIILLTLQHP